MDDGIDYLLKIAVLENEVRNLHTSIQKQAQEYERRLTELNHAHAQAVTDKQRFLDRELFYSKMDEWGKWRSEVDTWRAKVVGIAIGVGAVSGGIAGAIAQFFN